MGRRLSFSLSRTKEVDDPTLESHVSVLAMDEVALPDSLLSPEKIESIFSKIRKQNQLALNDLFPTQNPIPARSESSNSTTNEESEQLSLEREHREDAVSEIAHEIADNAVTVKVMCESDIWDVPSTAVTKQVLPREANTASHFGVNLYHLLRYHPTGISEWDIRGQFQRHFGCDIPFDSNSAMMHHVVGKCSHLFVFGHDAMHYKWLYNRNGLDEAKYLDLDVLPHCKLLQLLRRLIVGMDQMGKYRNHENMREHEQICRVRLSDLQSAFEGQFGGLFLCSDLHALMNRVGATRKIGMGTGEMYDYYIRWSHGEESMSAMSVVFKIWHILNKYPRGLRWSEVQHCYSTVYGEMLVLSEEGASSKKKWNAFITPTHSARRKKMVWRVADPSLCHGRLLLVDMTSPTKKVVHEMLRRCFGFTTSKQRHFVLNDIYPLRGAVADEGIWKFVVCFTRQRHADHFYREYASRDSQHAADARVSRIDLLFLKRTLDSMIPHPPPLSSPLVSSSSFASPLPFDIAVPSNFTMTVPSAAMEGNEQNGDALARFVEATSTQKDVLTPFKSRTKSVVSANPQTIENIWGLLTHHVDGLTAPQISVLMEQRRGHNQGLAMSADAMMEIMESQSSWFTKQWRSNGECRWRHRPLTELVNQSVLFKPERFVLYEYLEQFVESLYGSDIESTSRFRSNLLVHFRNERVADAALKAHDLQCRNVPIAMDHFCPQYSLIDILPVECRPLRFDARFSHLLSSQLSTHLQMSSQQLMEVMQTEGALHRRVENADHFSRLLLDAYSPHVHGQRSRDVGEWLFSSYKQFPRRMPPSLQNQSISRNAKHRAYYNDIFKFFEQYPNGLALSRFLTEFARQYQYLPAVPSLAEFLKSADIHSFHMVDRGDPVDLYLLRLVPGGDQGGYPSEGITLQGFPGETSADSLARVIRDNIGDCYVLRRGIDRFVVRFAQQHTAEQAKVSFASTEVQREGLQIVDGLPHLCGTVLHWVDPQALYF